jgi:ABC-2 type transport system ATP-binding protein
VIETQDLVKVYSQGKVKAVDKLNLRIKKGEIYAFIGANGSGKTTSLNMLTGVLRPTSGKIKILGFDIPKMRHKAAKYIGIAPQEYSIYQDLTVLENIKFFADLNDVSEKDFHSRFAELMKILRLTEKEKVIGAQLSGGMKRRVSIACALIHNPKIVFFDEATVGIDPILRNFFWEYFRQLKESGITMVITSHVMDEAERADRIGLMRGGVLIEEGTPAELKAKYKVSTIEQIFLTLSKGEIFGE